jgi:teichuronic acid biosynthesis glycosyltransferase TuaC
MSEPGSSGANTTSCFSSSRRKTAIRVLAVIPGDGQGNSFIFARRQVQSVARTGIDVQIFYLELRISPRGLFTAFRRLRESIDSYLPDVVHAHYGTITSFLCALSTRRPLIITFRGSDLNLDPTLGSLRARVGFFLSQVSALRASTILCTSDQLRRRLWWRKNKAVILPSGVDLELFQPLEKQDSRRRLGWGSDERVVLFNKDKAPQLKGLSLAREAVRIAENKLGLVRLVELDGEVTPERMPIYLNAADCLVLASESEGSPNILKEAMACNLPVASVDVGDAAERLDGIYPSQVVPRNAARLGQAISEILETERRSNGRGKVKACSADKIAETLRELYEAIVDEKRQNS